MSTATQQARARMLADQGTGIGGSEVHHVFNLEPYGCARQLAYQKRDQQPDYPFFGNKATYRGEILEPIAAQIYSETTGRQIRRVAGGLTGTAKRDAEYPYMLCHADREIVNDPRGAGMLSIKVPGQRMYEKVKWEGLPHSWTLQLQYELSVFNRAWGDYAIMLADDCELLPSADVERDDALIKEVREGVRQFWHDYIELEEAPLPLKLKSSDPRCKRCPFRTTCQGEALLAQMRKEESKAQADADAEVKIEIPYDHSLAELVQLRWQQDEDLKVAEDLVAETNNRIRAAMGDRIAVDTDGARIYYKFNKQTTTIKAKPLIDALNLAHPDQAAELAELAKKCTTTSAPSRPLKIYAK